MTDPSSSMDSPEVLKLLKEILNELKGIHILIRKEGNQEKVLKAMETGAPVDNDDGTWSCPYCLEPFEQSGACNVHITENHQHTVDYMASKKKKENGHFSTVDDMFKDMREGLSVEQLVTLDSLIAQNASYNTITQFLQESKGSRK